MCIYDCMWNPTVRLLINRFLSYLILSYLILSYLILSYLILSYLILSYLILSYLILSYLILSYLSYLILSYHGSRFCVWTEFIGVTFAFPLMVSFLILTFMIFPWLHLSIFISVVCKRCSSCLCNAQHSLPYTIDGLTTVLYSLLFSFTGTFLSHITPWRCRIMWKHNIIEEAQ